MSQAVLKLATIRRPRIALKSRIFNAGAETRHQHGIGQAGFFPFFSDCFFVSHASGFFKPESISFEKSTTLWMAESR